MVFLFPETRLKMRQIQMKLLIFEISEWKVWMTQIYYSLYRNWESTIIFLWPMLDHQILLVANIYPHFGKAIQSWFFKQFNRKIQSTLVLLTVMQCIFFYCLYSYYVKSKQTWIDLTSNNQMHLQSFDSKIPLNCINNNVFCRGKKKQFFIQIDIIIVSSNNWMGRYSTTECSANDWRCLMKIHLFKHIVKTNSSPTYMLNHCVCVYVYALHGMQTMIRFYCWFALCNNELVSSSAQKVFVCFHIRDANTKSF